MSTQLRKSIYQRYIRVIFFPQYLFIYICIFICIIIIIVETNKVKATISIKISNFIFCFNSFVLSCPILENNMCILYCNVFLNLVCFDLA